MAGEDSTTILNHYYEGATLGQVAPGTAIRVLILSRWTATAAVPLIVYGRLTPWTIDGIDAIFPADGKLRLIPTTVALTTGMQTTWRVVVDGPDGTTRLVTRERYLYLRPLAGVLLEPVALASFVMTERMLRGIRDRAESRHAR